MDKHSCFLRFLVGFKCIAMLSYIHHGGYYCQQVFLAIYSNLLLLHFASSCLSIMFTCVCEWGLIEISDLDLD
jgi:hypothetical protein